MLRLLRTHWPLAIGVAAFAIALGTLLRASLAVNDGRFVYALDDAYIHMAMARSLAEGPSFAHAMTKRCLHEEWSQSIEQALETEAEAQAICMQTADFRRAYEAFVRKEKPRFQGD